MTVKASKEGARKSRLNEASKKSNSIAKLLDTLFRIGAFDRKNTQYHLAVDGIMGKLTRNAIKKAKDMGYDVNEKTGNVVNLYKKGLLLRTNEYINNKLKKINKLSRGPIENPRNGNWFTNLFNKDLSKVAEIFKAEGLSELLIINLNIPKKPLDRNGNLTKECAAFVNATLKQNGINSYGDSFRVPNLFNKVVSGYDYLKHLPNNNESSIASWNKEASDSLVSHLDTANLNPNHVYPVNMYYSDRSGRPSSHTVDFYNKAKQSGSKYFGTHVGVLYHDLPSNSWKISHNIGGNLHNDELTEVLGSKAKNGYGIVGITDAGQIKKAPEIVYNPNGNQNFNPNKDDYKWYYDYVNPVKDLLGIEY